MPITRKEHYGEQVIKPRNETSRERLLRLTGFDMCRCPFCGKGTMRVIEVVPRARSPANINNYFRSLLQVH